jgi:hypothetical protein
LKMQKYTFLTTWQNFFSNSLPCRKIVVLLQREKTFINKQENTQ